MEWDPLNSVSVTKNKIGIYSINVYIINHFIGQRVYLLGTLQNGLKMSKWSRLSSILDFDEILYFGNFKLTS